MTIPDGFGLLSIRIRARWRTLALYPAVCMGVTTVFLLVAPARYRAEARFILNRGSQSSLSGLAAQLGFVAPAEASKSPEFYQDLVTSRDVLDLVASGSYAVAGRQNRVTLLALWGGDTADLARAKDRAFERLRRDLIAVGSLRTGIVTIGFESADPALAVQVTKAFIEAVTRFDRTVRQTYGATERRFLEGRLTVLRRELREAEDQLQDFLLKNRSTATSPLLAFERDRLQREVTQRQTVVTALAQSFEQARIDEARDTPAMSMVQSPENGLTRTRSWPLALLSALVVGLLLASVDFFVRESARGRTVDA